MEDLHEMYEAAIMHRVDWHCPGRHGVVRNVEKKDQNIIVMPSFTSTVQKVSGGNKAKEGLKGFWTLNSFT